MDVENVKADRAKLEELNCKKITYFADGSIFPTALDMIAYNRTCLSRDPDAEVIHIPPHHRLLAHFWSFTGYYARPTSKVVPKTP